MFLICLFNLLFLLNVNGVREIFERTYYWKLFNYDIDGAIYTTDADQETKVETILFDDEVVEDLDKFLIRKNLVPNHVTFNYDINIVCIPRTRPGIPFTINKMDKENYYEDNYSPLLSPFPTTKISKLIVSVYETAEDSSRRIWFVDTGFIDIPGRRNQAAPPTLYMYYRKNDKIWLNKEIGSNYLKDGVTSGLRSLTVDHTYPLKYTYVYISDDNGNAIIVYSFAQLEFTSRIERQNFGGEAWTFPVPQSILTYAQEVIRYRHNSSDTFTHYSEILKNMNISQRMDRDTTVNLSENNTNPRGVLYDRNFDINILFFTNEDRTNLYCWNMDSPMNKSNINLLTDVSTDNDFYISAINTVGTSFYLMINKLRNLTEEIYNENEINFAEYYIDVETMLRRTKNCIKPTSNSYFIYEWRKIVQDVFRSRKYVIKYVDDAVIQETKAKETQQDYVDNNFDKLIYVAK